MTTCRLRSRRRMRDPIRCGHGPAGGDARPAVGNRSELPTDGADERPRDAEIHRVDVRFGARTGTCTTGAYPQDCPKRAFETPIPR